MHVSPGGFEKPAQPAEDLAAVGVSGHRIDTIDLG